MLNWICHWECKIFLGSECNCAMILVSESSLRATSLRTLKRVGVGQEHAEMTVEVLVTADLQGIKTHGTVRLPAYTKRILKGLINPKPKLEVTVPAPGLRLVDGDDGLGPVVSLTGIRLAIKGAKETGICLVGCRRSNHFGAGAPYALEACREGMISLGGTNAFPSIAPTGSREVILGNNPIFIGIPRRDNPHFILDIAMSVVARGKIREAYERGERIPKGWALGPDGRPTTDPVQALKGMVLPIADHKGYGMSLAVDLIAGVLMGSGFGTGVLSMFQQWEKPQNVGHFFIVVDPAFFMPIEEFYRRSDALFDEIKNSVPINPEQPVLYPGEMEALSWDQQKKEGIGLDEKTWNTIKAFAEGEYEAEIARR
jgi:ureidoglycolate dehydrogenase (NAD+)